MDTNHRLSLLALLLLAACSQLAKAQSAPQPAFEAACAAEIAVDLRSVAACEASGRQISSAGNFNFVWNQMPGDEQKLSDARPKYPEDVSVSLQ